MGNACGNLVEYWDAIESTNFFMGGAIWDWVDQSIYNYDKQTGERYMAYGGDFGDTPNDGQFVLNGIVFGDLEPKPQYYEVKKVYQHIDVLPIDVEKGEFNVFNKYYYKDLSDYQLTWSVYENGTELQAGNIALPTLAPRAKTKITVPYKFASLKASSEYFVKFQFTLKSNQPWAKKDFVQAEEQMLLKAASNVPTVLEVTTAHAPIEQVLPKAAGNIKTFKGKDFTVQFDTHTGSIHSLTYGGETVIQAGNGPKLNAIRAFVNNDNWAYTKWYENGLHNLQHKASDAKIVTKADGTVVLSFTVTLQAPNAARIHGGTSSGKNTIEELTSRPFGENDFKFTTNQIWTIYKDGSIELQAGITSNQEGLILPRLGYVMKVPQKYSEYNYYGRGPADNYADRKSGSFIELHTSTVEGEFANFPKPQDMANHEDVRWCALTDKAGAGAVFVATDRLSVTALPYSSADLVLASHPYQLPAVGDTYLHLDAAVTGLGGNSCGQGGPLENDRVKAVQHSMGFIIRPAGKNLSETALVAPSGDVPISISRSSVGELKISSSKKDAAIMYSINGSKAQEYSSVLTLRDAATVTAWFKGNADMKTTMVFAKIESIKTKVIFTSSEEAGEGNASNLTDGDASTIWHTMYSVTVAKHPHWVDLDAGEVKMIKGFHYLPRSDGGNGNVKDYSIHVSMDGKEWGEIVNKGKFANNAALKKVEFDKPVKGRYIRFTALSEQRGSDFASGAEIIIMAE